MLTAEGPESFLLLSSNNFPEAILGRHKRQLPSMDYLAAHKNCKTQSCLLFALLFYQQYLFPVEVKNECTFVESEVACFLSQVD